MAINRRLLWVIPLKGISVGAWSLAVPALSAPRQVPLSSLSGECRQAIEHFGPKPGQGLDGPELHRDGNGDISIGWSRMTSQFFASASEEAAASGAIGKASPQVAIVTFSGATGGTERWSIRRNGLSVKHFGDSGYPGDASKDWKWDTVPFNYDPGQSY
jgi:hypothetical protein